MYNPGTTSPLASATLPAKPTSPPPQQPVQHAATISRHQTQQYSQQHVQQFATQAAPLNGPAAAPAQIYPADNRVQSPVPRETIAQPPAYSTIQREQQQVAYFVQNYIQAGHMETACHVAKHINLSVILHPLI